jgi:glucose/arabinose dehydrogenase
MWNFAALMIFFFTVVPAAAAELQTSAGRVTLTKVAEGFDVPWAIGFLPDGAALVTDRGDGLWLVRGNQRRRLRGLPKAHDQGQGGLLDVMVPRDFARSRQIYLTLSRRQGRGSGTAVATGRLNRDESALTDVRIIFEAAPHSRTGRHFGARVVEARDGTLFVSLGDRGEPPSAQMLGLHQGSVLRLTRDGAAAAGNPFAAQPGAQPEIWSYGHRNPQGMALDPAGRLWTAEHGARGGDEINHVRKGLNYGWPVISYGRHYSGAKIGEGTAKPGMEQPAFYWDPSIAPSSLMIYSGKLWPQWKGHHFVGSLKFDYIARLSGRPLRETEQLRHALTGRIRAIQEAPDGSIWFASETEGAIFRITP